MRQGYWFLLSKHMKGHWEKNCHVGQMCTATSIPPWKASWSTAGGFESQVTKVYCRIPTNILSIRSASGALPFLTGMFLLQICWSLPYKSFGPGRPFCLRQLPPAALLSRWFQFKLQKAALFSCSLGGVGWDAGDFTSVPGQFRNVSSLREKLDRKHSMCGKTKYWQLLKLSDRWSMGAHKTAFALWYTFENLYNKKKDKVFLNSNFISVK